MKRCFCAHCRVALLLLVNGVWGFGFLADARPIRLGASESHVAGHKSHKEYARLVVKLRSHGASVKSTNEKVRQPFFSVPGRIIKVNNEVVQVFEYLNPATTQSQAERVSPDGKTIGNSKPSWMSTPHFFKSQKLIVLYVGDDQTILRILQAEMGKQFAGR